MEAERIVQQLQQMLSKRLSNSALTSEEVCAVHLVMCVLASLLTMDSVQICETVTLLVQLEACSDDMRQQFLDWHQAYFEKRLASYSVRETSMC